MRPAEIHQSLTWVHTIFNLRNKQNTTKLILINLTFILKHKIVTPKIIGNFFNDNIYKIFLNIFS